MNAISFGIACLLFFCPLHLSARERLDRILIEAEAAGAIGLIQIINGAKLADLKINTQSTMVVRAIFYNQTPFVFQMQIDRGESANPIQLSAWRLQDTGSQKIVKTDFSLKLCGDELESIVAKISELTSQGSVLFNDAKNRHLSGTGVVIEILTYDKYVVRTREFDDTEGLDKSFMESAEFALLSKLSNLCGIAKIAGGSTKQ